MGIEGSTREENEKTATEAGVKRVVLPKSGRLSGEREQHEKQRWFREGFRFRAGSRAGSAYSIPPSGWMCASITEKKGWVGGLAGAS
jgi:hypothetical protein